VGGGKNLRLTFAALDIGPQCRCAPLGGGSGVGCGYAASIGTETLQNVEMMQREIGISASENILQKPQNNA
jgi:hypothetical protein